jgi:peroxiredoxin
MFSMTRKTRLLAVPVLFVVAVAMPAMGEGLPKAGDALPDAMVRDEQGREVSLHDLVDGKPTVLVFYRGGWCPFCTKHLKELAGIVKPLDAAGVQLLAISMDRPEKIAATPGRDALPYRLLSDSDAAAAKAFGIAFTVDDATVKKYKGFGIDLDDASGRDHHMLPHPAVFVCDAAGTLRLVEANPDYKVRVPADTILKAALDAAGRSSD